MLCLTWLFWSSSTTIPNVRRAAWWHQKDRLLLRWSRWWVRCPVSLVSSVAQRSQILDRQDAVAQVLGDGRSTNKDSPNHQPVLVKTLAPVPSVHRTGGSKGKVHQVKRGGEDLAVLQAHYRHILAGNVSNDERWPATAFSQNPGTDIMKGCDSGMDIS